MFTTLIENLKMIIMLCIAFGTSYIINTILGLYYNIGALKENFCKEKLISGLYKALILLGTCLMITATISMLPEILKYFRLESTMVDDLSVMGMAATLLSATIHYIKDGLAKLYSILNKENNIEI